MSFIRSVFSFVSFCPVFFFEAHCEKTLKPYCRYVEQQRKDAAFSLLLIAFDVYCLTISEQFLRRRQNCRNRIRLPCRPISVRRVFRTGADFDDRQKSEFYALCRPFR